MQAQIKYSYHTGIYFAQNSKGQLITTFDLSKAEQFSGTTFADNLARGLTYNYFL